MMRRIPGSWHGRGLLCMSEAAFYQLMRSVRHRAYRVWHFRHLGRAISGARQ